MSESIGRLPPEIESAIKGAEENLSPAEAALRLAAIANRATAALHQLVRAQANQTKGQPSWGRWASLMNASRDAVLRTATCRQTASQLVKASQAGTPE